MTALIEYSIKESNMKILRSIGRGSRHYWKNPKKIWPDSMNWVRDNPRKSLAIAVARKLISLGIVGGGAYMYGKGKEEDKKVPQQ